MHRRFARRVVALGAFGLVAATAVSGSSAVAAPETTESVIYATATHTDVTVYRQPLPQGTPEILFSYENPGTARGGHGIAAPELALAPDSRAVAYFARSGLRIRHLDTGADEVVIGRTERSSGGQDDDVAPVWTIPELNAPDPKDQPSPHPAGMFGLHQIAFSPDGRLLSFAADWFEYTDHLVIEIATGRHWRTPGSLELAWSSSSDRVAVTASPDQSPGNLDVSGPADYGTFQRITPAPEPRPDVMTYVDAAFAPAGDRIAFIYSTEQGVPFTHLASSALDGRGFEEIDSEGGKEALAWDHASGALYWVERQGDFRYIGVQYRDARTGWAFPENLTSVEDMWVTTGGHLVLVGRTALDADGGFMQRLAVIGRDGHQLTETPPFGWDSRFIGVV